MGGTATIDSGSSAWMLTSTLLVLMMLLPGLALFYGGLVRAKNLLSVMSQVLAITALSILIWVGWCYSLAFSGSGPVVGDVAKVGLWFRRVRFVIKSPVRQPSWPPSGRNST